LKKTQPVSLMEMVQLI